jgi:hypothetical protein
MASDYSIRLEARASGEARTAVMLTHGYRQGALTGAAMDLYLSTVGRGKARFSSAASSGRRLRDNPPSFVRWMADGRGRRARSSRLAAGTA